MARFFRSPKDLASWVAKLGASKAATVISNLPRVGDKAADIAETTKRIVEAGDDNAAGVLFDILKVAGVTEDEVAKTEDGVEQVRAADELLRGKVITADEHASMVKRAYVQRQVVNFDMPLRLCPKRMGKEIVSTYNCRHYCSDSFTLDDDPMRVYCAEMLWRRHVADKFSSDQQDRQTGELVGGYINERFYKFPDAGTPDNPDVPRDGGNPMMLKPGERTRAPRPHQWSVERRMQEAREKGSTKDVTLGKKASAGQGGWLDAMVAGETGLSKSAQQAGAQATCKMCGQAITFNGQSWDHVGGAMRHVAAPQDSDVQKCGDLPVVSAGAVTAQAAQSGGYVDFSIDAAGDLVMTPTSEGIEEAKARVQGDDTSDDAFLALIEDHLANGWRIVPPEEVGALTSALIITNDQDPDDVWSNIAFYQVRSELQDFAEGKPVTWERAPVEKSASADGMVVEAKRKKGKPVNPWAVCTKSVGRDDPDKYERCVLDVKEKHPVKESEEDVARKVILAAGRDNFVRLSVRKVAEATSGDEDVLKVFSMAVDLKNEGVPDEDAIIRIAEATGSPIEAVAGVQSMALRKLSAHVSDAYATVPEKAKPGPKARSNEEVQADAAELGLNDEA